MHVWHGRAAALAALAAFLAGACTPRPEGRPKHGGPEVTPKVTAAAVAAIGDWSKVAGTTLHLKPSVKDCTEGHLGEIDAVVKAQHTGDAIAVRVSWPDATRSDTHKSLAWDAASGSYKKGGDREDRVSLMFNMEGDFSSCMLSGKVFRADVWHWKAARTAPAGLAHDKYHVYSLKPVHKKSKEFTNREGQKVYMARASDAGDSLYAATAAPASKGADSLPGYAPNPAATGSIADVKAEATHDGATWTVTLTRKLATGHDDDVAFEKGKAYPAAVACFDRSGDMHHTTAAFVLVVE
ncbi:MAG: ethylbenzene dehydrogenase-related protein [Planctomycetota bacterium]|jgi:DMSO reductase family type II enzyme heme b subunit